MFKLVCAVKNYDWGKIGDDSEVFQLVNSADHEASYNTELPFAELWMGTHPSGPSYLAGVQDTSLAEYVSKSVDVIGHSSKEKFGRTLPFLLKVLSVNKALSIQAHPSKEHAVELNKQRPDLYKDDNHKPELAIALTPFEALVGFRFPEEIAAFIKGVPELFEIVGVDCLSDLTAASTGSEDMIGPAIKEAYRMLMCADEHKIAALVNKLRDRLLQGDLLQVNLPATSDADLATLTELFIRLSTDFPGDVGCFSLFFLNYVPLKPGEAIFLEANLPHAYLSGDCVECMACSDNVVRAGLTPKFKDVPCLLSMLLYEPRTLDELKFPGVPQPIEYLHMEPLLAQQSFKHQESTTTTESSSVEIQPVPQIISFRPPVEDFAVDKIILPTSCHAFELVPLRSASILLIIRGSGFLQRIPTVPAKRSKYSDAADSLPEENEDSVEVDRAPSQIVHIPSAGRVHETMEFTRGSVFFIAAEVGCFIQPYSCAPNDDHVCLVFRAYVNIDP